MINTQSPIDAGKALFAWYKEHLVAQAVIDKEELAQFFAPQFVVCANGQSHEANYANYMDFLNQFRETIASIDYTFDYFLQGEQSVTMPLRATIIRTDGQTQLFDAICILKFNDSGKVILWHEVYVERKADP
jgi:hypothetical protein